MMLIITIVANLSCVLDLHRRWRDLLTVTEPDDWDVVGSPLNAPSNEWQPGEKLAELTAEFPESAKGLVIQDILQTLQTAGYRQVLMLDPTTGGEIGRIREGDAAEDGRQLLRLAPRLEKEPPKKSEPDFDEEMFNGGTNHAESPAEFHFVLEGGAVKQDQAAANSDFDLVFRYDPPSDDALAKVQGDELERQRKAPDGAIDLLISLEGHLKLRAGSLPYGRATFSGGKLTAPVRFGLRAITPGNARVRVNFLVDGADIYRLVLELRVVAQIDAASALHQPLDIDLDEMKRRERTPRDIKLVINDAGGGWQVSCYSDDLYGEAPKQIADLNPGQLDGALNGIKPLLESVAKSPVWKSLGPDLKLAGGAGVPREILGNLLTAGWRLYKVLSQSGFGDYIRKLEGLPDGAGISIETKSAFIPWELLYPLEYNQEWPDTVPLKSQNFQPGKLWGSRFQIELLLMPDKSERVPPPVQVGPMNVSMIVGKTVAGGEASKEAVEWQSQYFQSCVASRGTYLTGKSEILPVFAGQDYPATFIYLLCHGQSKSPPLIVDDRLEFDTDFTMTPDGVVEQYGYPRRPVIFLNSCSVGAISPLAFTSFLRAFRNKQAYGLIASSFALPTRFAAAFGQKLLDGYLAKRPIGDVLFELRSGLYSQGNPLGMLYSLQCPLDVRAPQ